MSRRGENIYKRKDGRWEGRYIKSRQHDGKIKYGYVYSKNYKEAKEKLIVLKAQYQSQQIRCVNFNDTLINFLKRWLKSYGKLQLKETTYSKYSRIITNHIEPFFSNQYLHHLTENECISFLNFLVDKGLGSGSIRNIFNLLRKALDIAVREKYIEKNPCKEIILPRLVRKEVRALTFEEQRKIERIALEEIACSPIIVGLYTGMRIGELSGLRWQDIDFQEEIIYVRRTITRISVDGESRKTKLIIHEPKTGSSYRKIPLAKNLKAYLQAKKKSADSVFVFSHRGNFVEPRLISYRFKSIQNKAGLEDIHFHMLRHTFATRAIETGVDVASLSRILGHSSTKMTLDTYTYSIYDNRVLAMEKIDNLMSQPIKIGKKKAGSVKV
ncbi:site-specific integrase [Enterococcus rivorum]|uniref:Integrase n=1 Tax=Enterococcus rivorum TaxID=762845 RepID=A0A1E5KUZ0_9ENTE|nr:site-specific integrase [Enterococcus rivorum]MBP2100404.1 integrase [Enterococcus rivorum]OEH81706.1 hypothetical protein BCR26_15720 [Enterococcus rivorum]